MKIHERILQDVNSLSQKAGTNNAQGDFQQVFEKILAKEVAPGQNLERVSGSHEESQKISRLTEEVFTLLEKLLSGDKSEIDTLETKARELKACASLFSPSVGQTLEEISLMATVFVTKSREGLI